MSNRTIVKIFVATGLFLLTLCGGLLSWLVYPYFLPDDFSQAALDVTRERGAPIIAAIEAYRSTHGRHPVLLEEAGIHLEAFEKPQAGVQRWTYDGTSEAEYYLFVKTRIMPGPWGGITSYAYSSRPAKWQLVRSQPL